LLNKRRSIAGETPLTLDSITEKVKAVNDYSIVIQEYFKARVTDFLENYAKQVFGIEHYFARFEFAKSRGQIHVHLLAVLGKRSRITDLNELVHKERFNPENRHKLQMTTSIKYLD
jgi:hypothetical protein